MLSYASDFNLEILVLCISYLGGKRILLEEGIDLIFFLSFISTCVCACMVIHVLRAFENLWESEEGVLSLGTRVTGSCELSSGCWGALNSRLCAF